MATEIPISAPYAIDGKTAVNTPNPYERSFGYPRAVRKGPFIFVSGTTSLQGDGSIAFPGDAGRQADHIFDVSIKAVEALGGKKEDVVRVRMFVARHQDSAAVGKAFQAVFGAREMEGYDEDVLATGTAATMIVTGEKGFVDPGILVEIEMDALVL